MENHKNEYALVENSIISFVWRGALVGLVAGTVVSLFRLAIINCQIKLDNSSLHM